MVYLHSQRGRARMEKVGVRNANVAPWMIGSLWGEKYV